MSQTDDPSTTILTTLTTIITTNPETTTITAKPLTPATSSWYFLYYFYVAGALLIAIFFLTHYYIISQRNRQFQLSNQLKIHLITWVVCMTCTFIFFLNTILFKIFPDVFTSDDTTLWAQIRGSLQVTSAETIPLSTGFLLLDRVDAILFVSLSLTRRKIIMQIASVFAICGLFCTIFTVVFTRSFTYPNPVAACGFSCRIAHEIDDVLILKMIISGINLFIGSYFVYLYMRFAKNLTNRAERKKNYTVLLLFMGELVFTIFPTILYLSYRDTYLPIVNISPALLITGGYTTDGLITALIYNRSRSKAISNQKSQSVHNQSNLTTKKVALSTNNTG